jgi:WS/DGAT/MGAT family acyltransferase
MVRVHHALIDGGGALKLFRGAMSDSREDKNIRAIWMPQEKRARKKRPGSREPQLKQFLSALSKVPADIMSTGTEVAKMGAQSLKLRPGEASLPFSAPQTLFNNVARSSARRYANCELPLGDIRAISKQTGTTVNDVVTTIIDDALHQYLRAQDAAIDTALVSLMAMSVRTEGHDAAGNQVSAELVPMGQPDADIGERLRQVHESIARVKQKSARLPVTVRQFYSVLVFGSSALSDISSTFEKIPSANVLISNMIGPREQLYLGGMPMVAFQGLPIVPPGGGLNITFASFNDNVCLAIGAAPEAVSEPYMLIGLIEKSFARLRKAKLKRNNAPARKARTGA